MILEQRKIQVEKSSDFKETKFRIDDKQMNKMMWLTINQYRHKIRTPVQEIVSNARDAQRENGNPDKPLKIQLPTRIEPTFIVRDYGVGMDENRINTIFTSFGSSTKTGDNGQTGGFGIGAKSPLAYTDSFNIKTYVDGQYWLYVVAKTVDDGIGINLLGTGQTNEENGTEVQIPVKSGDTTDFIEAACRCTMFWEIQPEFNLLEEDLYKVKNSTEISNTMSIYLKSDLGNMFDSQLLIVIDGIPYEIDQQTTRNIAQLDKIKNLLGYNKSCAVFFLNTGDIDLLQTRESIEDTIKTNIRLQNLAFKGLSDLNLYIESCFTEKSLEGRIKQYQDISNKFNNIKANYFENMIEINNSIFRIDKELESLHYSYKSKTSSYRTVATQQRYVNDRLFKHGQLNDFYWDDIKDSESDTLKNRRLKNELEVNKKSAILIKQGNAKNGTFIKTLRLLGAKKLSSLALPVKKAVVRNKNGKVIKKSPEEVSFYPMTAGSYSAYKTHKATLKIKDINKTYVYVEFSKSNSYINDAKYVNLLKRMCDLVVCRMSLQDIKNIKDNKNFIHIDKYMTDFKPSKELIDLVVSKEVRARVKYDSTNIDFVTENSKEIKNKSLKKLAQCAIMNMKEYNYNLPSKIVDNITKDKKDVIEKKVETIKNFNEMMKNYPLLNLYIDSKENVFYINSKEL